MSIYVINFVESRKSPRTDDVSTDSRMVPVDYHIADTDLVYKYDLDQFVGKIKYVAKKWKDTRDKSKHLQKKKNIYCTILLFHSIQWYGKDQTHV